MFQVITIDAEAHLIHELQALLQQEQTALIDYDVDAVERIVDEKSALLQGLAEATQTRYSHLKSNGFTPNEKGMANWLAQVKVVPVLQAWHALNESLLQCKELNRVNAMLVSKFMVRNQNMLKAFQSNTSKNPVHLYSANGQTVAGPGVNSNHQRGFSAG